MSIWNRLFGRQEPTPTPTEPTLKPVQRSIQKELVDKPARVHAARLIQWVQDDEFEPEMVVATDLADLYEDMCEELGWRPRHWNTVGAEVKDMLGGKKDYIWMVDSGVKRRVRVYRIPRATNVVEFRTA